MSNYKHMLREDMGSKVADLHALLVQFSEDPLVQNKGFVSIAFP